MARMSWTTHAPFATRSDVTDDVVHARTKIELLVIYLC